MYNKPTDSDYIIQKAGSGEILFANICKKYVIAAEKQSKKAAQFFGGLNAQNLTKNLYHFYHKNIKYKSDISGFEEIRLPRESWAHRTTGIDCEDFVILLSGVLRVLKQNHTIRMVDYGNGWQHIYIIVPAGGSELVLDCTINEFNKEYTFEKKIDHKFTFGKMAKSTQYNGLGKYAFNAELARKEGFFVQDGFKYVRPKMLRSVIYGKKNKNFVWPKQGGGCGLCCCGCQCLAAIAPWGNRKSLPFSARISATQSRYF